MSLTLITMMLAACGAKDLLMTEGQERASVLDVDVSIANETSATVESTKAVVSGTSPANGFTFGLFACKHEETDISYIPFADKSNYVNIKAHKYTYGDNGWRWAYQSNPESYFSPLSFFSGNADEERLDFYAYAPWKSGITIQSGYNFSLNNQIEKDIVDLLYASYVERGSDGSNVDRVIDGSAMPLNLTFHHALSRIKFNFKIVNTQDTGFDRMHYLVLNRIVLNKNGTTTPLYVGGTMDLITHGLTPILPSAQSLTLLGKTSFSSGDADYIRTHGTTYEPYAISETDDWKSFNMLIYPADYSNDDDYSLVFYFNTSDVSNVLRHTYYIKKSDVKHSDGVTFGFQAGYTYNFYFIIDNYMRLKDIVISDDWGIDGAVEDEILM